MEVQTVTGKIPSSEMGVTLPHEHVFIDLRPLWSRPNNPELDWLIDAKVTLGMMGHLLHHATVCKDNLILDDARVAVKELLMFKALGGRTIIDVTSRGLSQRPLELREVSKKTGLNIVSGCGYYVAASHPTDMQAMSVDQLAEEMVRDITVGIDGTDVKAGIIGEIGTSHPITENERKVLRAAAHAQVQTGVSINVHMNWKGKHGPEVIDLLESEGVDPSRIILSHLDNVENPSFEYYKSIAERHAHIEFDCFGEEDYTLELDYAHPRDSERVLSLKRIIDGGYIDSILMSQDVCYKMYTRTYGGYGYDHIQQTILPMLRKLSVNDAEIRHMMIDNPRRAITGEAV